ncbi:MAG: hypothetical protein R6U44_09700 [Archaeoglobaceae archaeon]
MNTRRLIAGMLFLALAVIVFYFVPAFSVISNGVREVYYVNIAAGVALLVVGLAFLVTGITSRKVTIEFDEE